MRIRRIAKLLEERKDGVLREMLKGYVERGMENMVYHILIMVIGVLLFAAGITDIRKKQISRRFLLVLLPVCLAAARLKADFGVSDALGGMAVGLCAVGISMMSREQIGRGDGLVIAAVGLVLGAPGCLAAVCAASLMMCAAAIAVLIFKKGNRRTRLPFLPAIFAGYVLCVGPVL